MCARSSHESLHIALLSPTHHHIEIHVFTITCCFAKYTTLYSIVITTTFKVVRHYYKNRVVCGRTAAKHCYKILKSKVRCLTKSDYSASIARISSFLRTLSPTEISAIFCSTQLPQFSAYRTCSVSQQRQRSGRAKDFSTQEGVTTSVGTQRSC